ncbi:MAG: toll/interleukin-1 receptor domain-containing protein, partial [Oscillospiraceae bacterium]|nr:toll/interleukin-1 receptor domain-containing protein [Oscillospiraceae bacterium]
MTYFISYRSVSENDTKWAAWVESVLREAFGAKTIMQMYDFKVGDNFKAKMDDALKAVAADEDGGAVVCILSKEYSQSANCQAEWTNAKQLILIKVDDYKREGLLKHGVHIDLHKLGEEAAAKKLVEQIRGVERPEGRAPFPGKDASAAEEQAQKSYSLPARNPDFSGRQKQLRELSAQLQKTACVLLEGPGGYGKTAVAVEYAYLHRSDYALIGYFNAASEAQLQDDYRGFAREYLGVQDVTLAFDEVKRAVDAYLRNQASCLLIYDNAEGYALSAFLPTGLQSGAHVLICSRLPIAGIRVGMEQEPFSIPDAKKFVKHCLPKASAEDVAELAQTLGYLPLALECAVAYIKQNAYTICGYIRDFKQYKLDVLDENPHDPGKTIRTVWRSTFAKLEQEAEKDEAAALATVLLRLCAYCAPERIPLELFIDGDTLAQNKIAGYITRYKLGSLSRDSKGSAFLSMHRLMQEAAMDSLKLDTQWLDYCLDAVKPALRFDFGTREDFDAFNRNAPHAAQIAQHAETLLTQDAQKEKVGWTYHALGYGYHKVGDYDRALAWYKKAMAICEIVLGTEHPHTATTYNNIAGIYDSKGDYAEALGWYKKALTVFEKVLGTEHPDTATTYNNLAMLYYSKGDYDWALEWYKKALAIYEKVLGTEHPDTATSYNNIALVYDGTIYAIKDGTATITATTADIRALSKTVEVTVFSSTIIDLGDSALANMNSAYGIDPDSGGTYEGPGGMWDFTWDADTDSGTYSIKDNT